MTVSTIGSILQFIYLFIEFVETFDATDGAESSHSALAKWRRARGLAPPSFSTQSSILIVLELLAWWGHVLGVVCRG